MIKKTVSLLSRAGGINKASFKYYIITYRGRGGEAKVLQLITIFLERYDMCFCTKLKQPHKLSEPLHLECYFPVCKLILSTLDDVLHILQGDPETVLFLIFLKQEINK